MKYNFVIPPFLFRNMEFTTIKQWKTFPQWSTQDNNRIVPFCTVSYYLFTYSFVCLFVFRHDVVRISIIKLKYSMTNFA